MVGDEPDFSYTSGGDDEETCLRTSIAPFAFMMSIEQRTRLRAGVAVSFELLAGPSLR